MLQREAATVSRMFLARVADLDEDDDDVRKKPRKKTKKKKQALGVQSDLRPTPPKRRVGF